MFGHVRFTCYDRQDFSISPNDESLSFVGERSQPFHTELFRCNPVWVRQQRDIQLIDLVKLALPIPRISADPDDRSTDFLELFGQVPEVTAFFASTRC